MTEPTTPARASWDTDELPQGEEKVAAVQGMFDAIAPRYDRLNRIISFRLDVRWRKRAVRDLALAPGSLVLDLASGTVGDDGVVHVDETQNPALRDAFLAGAAEGFELYRDDDADGVADTGEPLLGRGEP